MESVLLRGIVHATNHFGEKFSVQIGQQHPQRVRLAGDEAARPTVRDIAHSAGDFANAAPRFIADGPAAIQNSGDSGDGNVGFARDILDRDHSPPSIGPLVSLGERASWTGRQLNCWPIFAYNGCNM